MRQSNILICPVVQLHALPDAERDVLRRFFTEHVRGMDSKHHKRWTRFIRDLFNATPGEGFQIQRVEARGGPFHRRHRVILERLFQSQERFRHVDKLHDWLKVGAGFVSWKPGKDQKPVAIPRSTSFDNCSEDEMREFHTAAVDFLHTERAQRRLWTQVKPSLRQGMLDAVLRNPEEDR